MGELLKLDMRLNVLSSRPESFYQSKKLANHSKGKIFHVE